MKYLGAVIGILCIFIIYKPHGAYSDGEEEECDPNVVDDLNRSIEEALVKYTEHQTNSVLLTEMYNEIRKKLSYAFLQIPAKQDDCQRSQDLLDSFLEIAPNYDKIVPKILDALEDLNRIHLNPDSSIEDKYQAVKIKTKLKFSDNIQDAEMALLEYEDFKNGGQ